MKNLILQVDISGYKHIENGYSREYSRVDELYRASKISAIDYAKKYNADYICLSNDILPGNLSPVYQRLGMYDIFDKFDYDFICYLDCDIIVNQTCPNIFEFQDFSVAPNCEIWEDPNEKYPYDAVTHGYPNTYTKFFNSGILLVPREFCEVTKPHLREEIDYWNKRNDRSIHDQSVLNCLAYKYWDHNRINILSDKWGPWWKEGEYMNHFSSFRKGEFKP